MTLLTSLWRFLTLADRRERNQQLREIAAQAHFWKMECEKLHMLSLWSYQDGNDEKGHEYYTQYHAAYRRYEMEVSNKLNSL